MSWRPPGLTLMLLASSGLVLAQPLVATPASAARNAADSPTPPAATVNQPRADLRLATRVVPTELAQAGAAVAERRLDAPVVVRPVLSSTHARSDRHAGWSTDARFPRAERFQAGLREARLAAGQRAVVVTRVGSFAAAERRVFLRNHEVNAPVDLSPPARP